ncbi:uncharacterized protein RSE6_09387 [Rhynchosporium secalis]|uniref:Uncharacterized protein n=1 Tax=Rhynchosporium secalis TaxID=38038 RepID=A0A1E1MHW4_RHYSE|nr:uncharacterized protein RSE6_09387 [Rhynchosporium secalis]
MCVTNVYIDRYPDGKEIAFRQTAFCTYGRPCQKLSTLENPVRKIQFGEPTTEYIMTTQRQRMFPHTPPRSAERSQHRRSGESSSEEGRLYRRKSSKSKPAMRATRTHRKERIIIVDSPPTPRTPPPTFRTFTAPSSPATPTFIIDGALHSPREQRDRDRGRPVIVDERPHFRHPRVPSIGAVVGERSANIPIPRTTRTRSISRKRASFQWESPSTSHTSFDSRARLEAEELSRRREAERDQQKHRLAQRIREQDEAIRRRPAVPIPPQQLRERQNYLRPVVDQSEALHGMLDKLTIRDERSLVNERALIGESEMRRRMDDRERIAKARLVEIEEEEMRARLKERQMPRRRASVGPGNRRHRVLYDDGVYRWE